MSTEVIGVASPRPKRLPRAGSPLTLSFGASLMIQGCNVVTGLLLARTLGPHGRGELAAVVLWPSMIATVGCVGLTDAVTFHVARKTVALGTLLGSSIAIMAAQSLICVTAGLAIVPLVFSRYDAETLRAAYVFLAFVPLNIFSLVMMSMLNGLHRFAQYHGLRIILGVSTAAAIVGLRLADDLTVLNAVLVYLSVTFAAALAAVAMLPRADLRRLSFSAALSRQLLSFGFKSHTGIVTSMMNERLDQLVISVFLSPIQLGLYAVAVTLTSPAVLIGSSVASATFPIIARLESADARRDAVRRFLRLTIAGSVVVVVPMIILMSPMIAFFFKETYLGATNVTRVLLVAAVALGMNRVLTACVKALDRPLEAGFGEFLALGVTVVALAVLLPVLGIMGAAVASLLAYAVSTAWMLRRTTRAVDMSLASVLLPDGAELRRMARAYWRPRPLEAGE